LGDQPDEAARIARLRPHGPLACTHLRGGVTPSRYDHLLVTDDVGVEAFRYVIGDAFAAGSDHALVQATLRISANE
jgi:endonuclease/exonuclease/phosphatase family metal-dependent hydrolase